MKEQIKEMNRRLPTIEEIEKDYKEWCVNLIKVRFDLKPEYYDEHHHNNYTYENCADCLWNSIKGTIEELLWLKEDYYKLREQLIFWKDRTEQTRKETAKEILQGLYDHCFELVDPFCDDCEECYGSCDKYYILAIAKQYGVEVEE